MTERKHELSSVGASGIGWGGIHHRCTSQGDTTQDESTQDDITQRGTEDVAIDRGRHLPCEMTTVLSYPEASRTAAFTSTTEPFHASLVL